MFLKLGIAYQFPSHSVGRLRRAGTVVAHKEPTDNPRQRANPECADGGNARGWWRGLAQRRFLPLLARCMLNALMADDPPHPSRRDFFRLSFGSILAGASVFEE